jgi:peptide chain release factor 1
MSFEQNLHKIIEKHDKLSQRLSEGILGEEYIKASKEFYNLEPIVNKIKKYLDTDSLIKEYKELLENSATDLDLKIIIEEELVGLEDNLPIFLTDIKIAMLPKDEADEKNALIEIRAGTGGDEAGLFVANLLGMYLKYAENKKWKAEILSLSDTGIGGYKEAIILVTGSGAYAKLKYESGVHRVQRVPDTESSGRIHTSAATVAVLPEAEEIDIQVNESDLRIDTYRASGAGGQHVNTTDSAVRITHIPTGIVICQQDERSQVKNKAKAFKILRAKLYEYERLKQEKEISSNRKSQIGSGDRSERIRTYNYPQSRVTDHRINLTLYKIEEIVKGGILDEIIDALSAQNESDKLSTMENESK